MANLSNKIQPKSVLLQVLPALNSGGVERGTIEMAKAASRAGFTSLIASNGGAMEKQLDNTGVEHILLPLHSKNPLTMKLNTKHLKGIIRDYGVDIVHARSRAPAWSAYKASKSTGCHFVTTFHGYYSLGGTLKKRYNSVMTKGEKVIAISNFISEHIKHEYHTPEDHIHIIPRGVDLAYFEPNSVLPSRISILREKWGLKKNWPVILLPGRITRWKGQEFLIRALSQIESRLPFYCVIAGDYLGHEKYYNELQTQVEESHLGEKVKLVGRVEDMPAAYMIANVVVSASQRPEAFGRVAIEAQAMGKPIVATDIGGSRETIINGKTGALVDPMFTKDMAKALNKYLMLDKMEQMEMAGNNRQHIINNFSLLKMCKATINLYREILSGKG